MDTNLIKAFSGLADAARENVYPTDINSKVDNLAQKQKEKLERLGANSQYANLSESYTKLDTTGTIESNKNKIWNNNTAAEAQMALGEAMNETIYRRDDGSKYQIDKMGNERDFSGDSRRLYLYGTKEDPNAVKMGLALGELPSSDYRYQPGRANREGLLQGKEYGWDPGEDGVDVNKKYLDVELPYNTATALEAMNHGRTDALANRMYPDYLSKEAVDHASGVSEYYNSMEGLLGDSRNQEMPAQSKLEEYKKLAPASDGYVAKGQAFADTFNDVPDYNQARGFGANILNVGAKIASLAGEGIQTLGEQDEKFQEREQARLDKMYPGEKVSDWRKNVSTYLKETGGALNKEMREFQLNNDANKITGYDTKDVDELQQEIGGLIKDGKYATALGKALTDSRSLEVLTNSAPEMVALAASVGGMAVVNVHNNIDLGQAEIGREFTTREKTMSAITSIVSTYLDRAGDKLALNGMNEAKGLLKSAVDNAPETVQKALATKYGDDILKIGKLPLKLAGAGAAEGVTEYGQTLGETAARDPKVFEQGFTEEQKHEAEVAGVLGTAMGAHMSAGNSAYQSMKGKDREKLQAELDELKTSTANEAKSNMESTIDITAPVEITEADTKVEEILGVASVNRLKDEATSVDELLSGLNETKAKIIGEAYEVEVTPEGETRIVGVKDLNKAEAAIDWMDQYATTQANADGIVPKGIADEVTYVKNMLEATKEKETATAAAMTSEIGDKVANKIIKDTGPIENIEDVKSHVEAQIDKIISENESLKNIPNIKESVAKKVLDTYGISGMSGLGNGISIQMDKDELNNWVKDSAGLKTNLEQRATPREGKVVETGSVTNEELDAIMEGEGTIYDSSHPNTKLRERVLRHLDPLVNKNNTVNTLRDIKYRMVDTIGKNLDKAGRLFKGGDTAGNMMRLMVVAANTINGQVVSDTNMRASVDLDDSMTMKDEYWASMSSTMEQIGKDYASSYGLKLAGSPEALSKAHRDIGRFAIELLQDAGLAEVTQDTMRNRVGDVVTPEGERLISSAKKVGVGTTKTTDTLTGEEVLMSNDRGIRLTDTVNRVDPLDETKAINKYKSDIGDALSRVSKLLLPNANVVPETEYVKKDLKIDPEIKVNKDTVEAVQANMAKPVTMKTGKMRDVLEHLKGLNEGKGFTDNAKKFLGLVGTGAKLLEVNEDGKIMNRMNNILGILDNLDILSNPDGVHYHFQIDINNRTTIQEGVGNYQGDKDYARPIMGVGRHVTKSKAAKDILVSDLVDNLASKDQKNMDPEEILSHYAELLTKIEEASKGDMEVFMQVLVDSMEPGYALAHLKSKGGLRVLNALEGARDVVKAGDGPITTEYVPEKDARASGVQNTIINIAGRNVALFKDMLSSLGVKFKGEAWPTEVTDAYSFLSQKLTDAIDNLVDNTGTGLALAGGSVNLEAVKKIKETLDDPKLMRELAKYPIMTWFYSAGEKSIVENLTQEVTQTLVEKAVAGDEKVLKYLSDVMGKEITARNVKDITKGSKEHVALRNELQKIGKAFHSKLTEAFPQVEENKKEMESNFKFTVDVTEALKKATGKDYWGGKIRTALGAVKGTNDTMSLYKQRNTAMGLSAEEKLALGIAAEGEQEWLVTKQMRMPNMTSLMALMMHSVDAAQQAMMLEKLQDVSKAILTKHDGFSGRPEDLVLAQKELEKATIEIALAYDIMNETAMMMRAVAKEIKEDLDNLDIKAKTQAEFAIKQLEGKAAEIEKVNNPRMEAKAKLFKDAKTQMFGSEGYVGFEEEKVEATEESTPEEVRKETVDRVYSNVLDMVEELPTMDERKFEVLGSDVKIVTLNENTIKDLIRSTNNMIERKNLKAWATRGGSFTFKGTVYVGKNLMEGKDEVSGKQATTQQVLDTLMHEIEHAVVDNYVDKEKDKAIKAEYDKLKSILERAIKNGSTGLGRVDQRVTNILGFAKQGNYEQAIKELIATSREEEVAGDVFNKINKMAGISGNALSSLIKSIWSKIEELFKSKSLKELLDASDVYTIAVAVKSIQDKARGNDTALAKVDDGIIKNTDVTPFDVSGFTTKIETIC